MSLCICMFPGSQPQIVGVKILLLDVHSRSGGSSPFWRFWINHLMILVLILVLVGPSWVHRGSIRTMDIMPCHGTPDLVPALAKSPAYGHLGFSVPAPMHRRWQTDIEKGWLIWARGHLDYLRGRWHLVTFPFCPIFYMFLLIWTYLQISSKSSSTVYIKYLQSPDFAGWKSARGAGQPECHVRSSRGTFESSPWNNLESNGFKDIS